MIRKTLNVKSSFAPPYEKLLVWQVADRLTKQVYIETRAFPKSEVYGLTSQLRRAALSIVLNIIEGWARNNKNEFRQFLRIALGSLAETRYLLVFANDQGYLSGQKFQELTDQLERSGQLLWKLFKSQT